MISDNNKVVISFNAVVETEIKQCKEMEMTSDEMYEVLSLGNIDNENKIVEIDQVDEVISQQLNETLLGIMPDELKINCVSMTFTDIKIALID
ncbi:MAG: hypothetical protein PHH37_08460 [Paludibacter sp.]|nr:hypothetical protein [Paludibacter sp.]